MCKQENMFLEGGPWNLTLLLRKEWETEDYSHIVRMSAGAEGDPRGWSAWELMWVSVLRNWWPKSSEVMGRQMDGYSMERQFSFGCPWY